ncbi:hypothetical protein HUA76_12600 [Myxococcus sp. CA056]|uniref:hypothetical protein n=1 Tax=Myxococcus sp. CA056 TaxID=2741740 RepID=UPI00157B256D|nr:hypothetical protein [Myxococcus sp. CA056]NTX11632.1 hypothetical protein [Myxococcus sp. CA056]
MSTHADNEGRRLLSGEPLCEEGSYLQATLGGWFRLSESGAPVLLTVEHLLTPDPIRAASACLAVGGPPPRLRWQGEDAIVNRRPEGRWLCHATSGERVARVLASGVRPETGHQGPLDACIAAPVAPSLGSDEYPPLPWVPRVAEPREGSTVLKFTRRGGLRHGRILCVSESGDEVLVTSTSEQPFAVEGDSGALLIDVEARAAIGMHVGEVYMRYVKERQWAVLWRARPLPLLMKAFHLRPY